MNFRYKLDICNDKKALLKLMTEAEKLKKLMSFDCNRIPLYIEYLMEGKDVKGHMDVAAFEKLIADDLSRIEATLRECLQSSRLRLHEIYSVEIVGASSVIPSVRAVVEKVFQKAPSTTLNANEAVSRGCAIMSAILSPQHTMPDFAVTDVQPYPIKLVWQNGGGAGSSEMEIFPEFHAFPFSKLLTFFHADTFKFAAEYDGPVPYPYSNIGVFEVGGLQPKADGGKQKVKVKVRVNPDGIFVVLSASIWQYASASIELPVSSNMQGQLSFVELKVYVYCI